MEVEAWGMATASSAHSDEADGNQQVGVFVE
jgi:hypothetical protein